MQCVYFFDGGLQVYVFLSWYLAAGCNLTLSVHFLSRYRWAAIVRWRKKVLSLQSCSGVGGTGDRRRGQVNNPQQLGGQKQGPSGAVCDFRVFIFREKGKSRCHEPPFLFQEFWPLLSKKGVFLVQGSTFLFDVLRSMYIGRRSRFLEMTTGHLRILDFPHWRDHEIPCPTTYFRPFLFFLILFLPTPFRFPLSLEEKKRKEKRNRVSICWTPPPRHFFSPTTKGGNPLWTHRTNGARDLFVSLL